jgi:transposase
MVDALGNPLRFILTAGASADCHQAIPLMQGFDFDKALMDKAYDTDKILEYLSKNNAEAVIPPKSNRKNPRECDFFTYASRHKIECFFGYMKHYRRIFSRFDKKDEVFLSFICFAATLILLK